MCSTRTNRLGSPSWVNIWSTTKRWEAANGFELTDEVVVTIAMQAAVLILGLDTDYFCKVTSIIVHPTTFSIPGPRPTSIRGMVEAGRAVAR